MICLNCGVQIKLRYKTENRKYCSNKCQQEYRYSSLDVLKTDRSRGNYLRKESGNICFVCGISNWNNKKLKMELDHIDGNHLNNTKSNLRLICPNCHSQTDTYKAKNKGNGRKWRRSIGGDADAL